jgi:predicted transcriptional regulator
MKTRPLTDILERVETWPSHVQDELAAFARELDAGVNDIEYQPTPEELAGIERGLRDAEAGRFASEAQVEAAFAKFRGQ